MNSLRQFIDPHKTALLIVDMQNDFCHPNGVSAQNGFSVSSIEVMLPSMIRLIEKARRVDLKIIFIRTTHDDWTDSSAIKSLPRYQKWSSQLCRPGTWGAEFFGVSPEPNDYVVTKHRNSAFINTPLDLVLRSIGMKTIIVMGVTTHVCVESTIRDGFQYDYFPIVPSDCTATGSADPQVLKSTLDRIDGRWGKVVTTEEILRVWGQ